MSFSLILSIISLGAIFSLVFHSPIGIFVLVISIHCHSHRCARHATASSLKILDAGGIRYILEHALSLIIKSSLLSDSPLEIGGVVRVIFFELRRDV